MNFWYDYRTAWARAPWLLVLGIVSALLLVAGIFGTVARDVLTVCFIPGLIGVIGHHLLVQRKI